MDICVKVIVTLSRSSCMDIEVSSDGGAALNPTQIGLDNDINALTQIFVLGQHTTISFINTTCRVSTLYEITRSSKFPILD